jgi:predicted nucleic acid-binding protein
MHGDYAFQLLQRTIACEFKLIISNILLAELEKYLEIKQLDELLSWIKPKSVFITVTSDDKRNARTICAHYPDSLHFVLAQRTGAQLISNDKELLNIGAISARDL